MAETFAERANKLPLTPGVYIMLDSTGKVIYVGKAKKLKNRVSSYFRGSHNAKTEMMISKIADFQVIMVNTEFEALVLEDSLIKHYMPQYNILLKDDKGYPFIRIDEREAYPTFSIVSRKADDGADYFGPFGGRQMTTNAINTVKKILKLPACSKKFPRDIGKDRPCLNYHMGYCRAYCLKDTPRELHDRAIKQAIMIFDGKTSGLLDSLKSEMNEAAEKLRFEQAAEIRDEIKAIQLLEKKQYALSQAFADTDAVGVYTSEVKSCFVVLHYIEGRLLGKDIEFFDSTAEDGDEALSGFLRQYYMARGTAPVSVCLPEKLPDSDDLERFLKEKLNVKFRFSVPQSGEKLKYVQTAQMNAREETERTTTKEERVTKTAEWLKNALGLDAPPDRFEAYDVSNTGSSDIVASMTVFKNGKPYKSGYRKFKIRSVDEPDDYASMEEVVTRRLQRYIDGDEKFSPLPDVMLIDGGEAHAARAKSAAEKLGIRIPIFGMVKDDRHRTRALVTPYGEEIGIVGQPNVFAFIGTIQEETHRFAITFHHESHTKSMIRSKLDGIPNVGEARKKALLSKFGSVKAVGEATVEELMKVVPKNAAEAVFDRFHGKKE